MDEKKPAAKDDSVLNAIARTVGTTAGIIVSKAAQFTEAAAQASGVSKPAKAPARKASSRSRCVPTLTHLISSRLTKPSIILSIVK